MPLFFMTSPSQLEENLQDWSKLKWYLIPIFVMVFSLVIYLVHKKKFNMLLGGFAFWIMDVFNETWNSVVYATTGSPVWGTISLGDSAFQILIGYNIEISLMFLILGFTTCLLIKTSPEAEGDKFWEGNKNWLNDPNNMFYKANVRHKYLSEIERKTKLKAVLGRIIPAVIGSILAVCIECLLNYAGLLTWDKSWWQRGVPYLIFLIGYCPFFFSAVIVHDLPRKWQVISLGTFTGLLAIALIVLGSIGMLGPQIPLNWPFKN